MTRILSKTFLRNIDLRMQFSYANCLISPDNSATVRRFSSWMALSSIVCIGVTAWIGAICWQFDWLNCSRLYALKSSEVGVDYLRFQFCKSGLRQMFCLVYFEAASRMCGWNHSTESLVFYDINEILIHACLKMSHCHELKRRCDMLTLVATQSDLNKFNDHVWFLKLTVQTRADD